MPKIIQLSFGDGFSGSHKLALLSTKLLSEAGYDVTIFVSPGSLTKSRAIEAGLKYEEYNQPEDIENFINSHNKIILISHHSAERKLSRILKNKYPHIVNVAYRHNESLSIPLLTGLMYNKYFDMNIACSEAVRKTLITKGIKSNKVKTVYCGIEIPAEVQINREKVRKTLGLNNETVLGVCSWFHKERKGFDILFKAFGKLTGNYKLLLIGIPDNMKKEVLDFAKEMGANTAKIVTQPYTEDIWLYYTAIDIFLLPSRSEGFPLTMLEAAYSNIPIIATNIGGVNEFIENGKSGIMFGKGKVQELAAQIEALAKDNIKMKILTENAKRELLNNYTAESYKKRLVEFIGNLNI